MVPSKTRCVFKGIPGPPATHSVGGVVYGAIAQRQTFVGCLAALTLEYTVSANEIARPV